MLYTAAFCCAAAAQTSCLRLLRTNWARIIALSYYRIIALSHYRIMRYAQNAATRKTLLRAKRYGGKDASKCAAKASAVNYAVLP